MLEHLARQGVTDRLELVLVDRGVTAAAARALAPEHGLEVRRVGWDDKQPVFRPIRHAGRVEFAHCRSPASRRRCGICHGNELGESSRAHSLTALANLAERGMSIAPANGAAGGWISWVKLEGPDGRDNR